MAQVLIMVAGVSVCGGAGKSGVQVYILDVERCAAGIGEKSHGLNCICVRVAIFVRKGIRGLVSVFLVS